MNDLSTLRIRVEDRVATVTLDDPQRRNAISLAMVDDLNRVFDQIESDTDVGAVVVAGAPPAFCAGADLTDLAGGTRAGLTRIYEGFLRVARCPLPTVAAVGGAAVGAGMNLALACDVRVAGPRARFDCRFLELGLHPGGGHTWMLQRLVGPQTARAMVLFGAVLDADAAAERGLAWSTVASDDGLAIEAQRLAAHAASAPRTLAVKAKATLRDVVALDDHADAVARELDPQVWSIEQPAFAKRLAALRSKIARRS